MPIVNIFEAKTNLSKLVARAEQGEEIIIARNGKPAVRLTQLESATKPQIRFGGLKGKIWVADDFDDDLPEDLLKEFEGDIFPPMPPDPVSSDPAPPSLAKDATKAPAP